MAIPRSSRLIPPACLAALALLAALAPGPSTPTPTAPAAVPFELLETNHMLVRATINGKGPFRLIFDLGSPLTLLGGDAAERSGVIKADAPRSFLFGARGEAEVDTLKVGDLEAEDVPVVVMDHPLLKAMSQALGRPIDGLIGYTFFARYRTTIDYQAARMTFEPVPFKIRNLMADLPDRLAGPKVVRRKILAPGGLWGLKIGPPEGGLKATGVPILAVLPRSPAAQAGLRTGDILTTLDGRWTASVADTFSAAERVPPGLAVPLVLQRAGREQTLTLTPADGL